MSNLQNNLKRKLHIAHPEAVYKKSITKAINTATKEREAKKAYYSDSKNKEAALEFIFGNAYKAKKAVPANKTTFPKLGQTSNETITNAKEREEKGLSNRKNNIVYTLQPDDSKICVSCNIKKTSKDFYSKRSSSDGLMSKCKACDKKRQEANAVINKKLRSEDTKNNVERVCKSCKTLKPITEYVAVKTGFRGSRTVCKSCK